MLKVTTFSNEIYGMSVSRLPGILCSEQMPAHLSSFVLLHQVFVDDEGTGARGQAEDERMCWCWVEMLDPIDDVAGYVSTGRFGVVADDEPHIDGDE